MAFQNQHERMQTPFNRRGWYYSTTLLCSFEKPVTTQESGAWIARLDNTGTAMERESKVWSGNAKTCAVRTSRGGSRLYLGTEPADVLTSDDMGRTWLGTDSFAAVPERWVNVTCMCSTVFGVLTRVTRARWPCREKWTFPARPHVPHVMSIDFGGATADAAADSAVVLAGMCK